MSSRSDIYVFICISFVLVELFNEWFYSFYNGGYLSGEDLRVLAFSCEIMGKNCGNGIAEIPIATIL